MVCWTVSLLLLFGNEFDVFNNQPFRVVALSLRQELGGKCEQVGRKSDPAPSAQHNCAHCDLRGFAQ